MTQRPRVTLLLNGLVIGEGVAIYDEADDCDEPSIEPVFTHGRLDMVITDPAVLAELRAAMPPMLVCADCGEGVEVSEDVAAEYDGADLICEECYHVANRAQSCATCRRPLECGPAEYTFCGECWDRRGAA